MRVRTWTLHCSGFSVCSAPFPPHILPILSAHRAGPERSGLPMWWQDCRIFVVQGPIPESLSQVTPDILSLCTSSSGTNRQTWSLYRLPRWLSGKSACQCRRRCFDPWVGKIPWRRKWQPAPVFLLGESHGQRSLVGYSSWGCRQSDMTEQMSMHTHSLYSSGYQL